MKKILLITLVALLGIATANAQIKVGAKAGGNLATITDENAKFKLGFHIGGFAEFTIADRIAIQPELLFSTQGASIKNVDNASLNLSYLNVPVLLKVKLTEGLSAEVGPQVGFLLSAKSTGEESRDLKERCKTLDFTAVAGLSYTFAEKFVVGARYNFGLTNVYKETEDDSKLKNSVIQVSFGYKF
ncbi:MAG: PorT family protein [Prevotellaceae bacterium]|nr:PorT family protein [Prevotellaceae bacterium]